MRKHSGRKIVLDFNFNECTLSLNVSDLSNRNNLTVFSEHASLLLSVIKIKKGIGTFLLAGGIFPRGLLQAISPHPICDF